MNGASLDVRNAPLPVAAAIMREAAQWLIERGDALWEIGDLTPEKLGTRCQPHEVFVGYRGNEAIVTALVQEDDPLTWPGVGNSIFVHKFAVRRSAAGQGVAAQMLEWIIAEARRRKKEFVRLDCAAGRPKLCAVYERGGFRYVETKLMGNLHVALYELAL